jgi:hypothetical protein
MSIILHNFNGITINQVAEDMFLGGTLIPKGYVNATEMCKANGKRWDKYIAFSKTPAFLQELSRITVDPSQGVSKLPHIIQHTEGQRIVSTWISFPVATNLASWISPEFAAWASIALSHIMLGNFVALTAEAQEAQRELKEVWDRIRSSTKVTRRTLTDAIKDWYDRNPGETSKEPWLMYALVTNAIYQKLWGMDALQIESVIGCKRNKSRDYLSVESLKDLEIAESNVADYIDEDNIHPLEAVKLANIRRRKLSFKDI